MLSNTQSPIQVAGTLPTTYHEVLFWQVRAKRGRMLLAQALAFGSFCLFGVLFVGLALSLGKLPLSGSFTLGLRDVGALFGGMVFTLVAHELIHGLVMRLAGAKPTYGVIWNGLMLYATSPGHAYPRNTYVAILLAPFVVISTLVLLGIVFLPTPTWIPVIVFCGVINASGAIGDMWMTRISLRYPATAYILDEKEGMRVFLPKPGAA